MSATVVGTRYRTGEICQYSGVYAWDGYTDGTRSPLPTPAEMKAPFSKNERFTPIRSAGKACWWKLIQLA